MGLWPLDYFFATENSKRLADNIEYNRCLLCLEELLNNQDERFPYVEKMHADDTENLTVKLQVNRDEQEDLKRQLQEKQNEEKKLRATLYHHKCQYEKFEKVKDLCLFMFTISLLI